MIDIRWIHAELRWIVLLAPVLFVAWIIGEQLRRIRLKRFGDFRVLGIRRRWLSQGVAAASFCLAVGFTAVTLAVPIRNESSRADSRSMIHILLDSGSFKNPDEQMKASSEHVQDFLELAIQNAPEALFSLSRSSNPAEMLVPPTWDTQGFLMAADAVEKSGSLEEADALAQTFRRLSEQTSPHWHLIVISARPREELGQLMMPVFDGGDKIVFMRITPEESAPMYGVIDNRGGWSWSSDPGFLRAALGRDQPVMQEGSSWLASFSLIQICAFCGFLLLTLESLLRLTAKV
jgi:hypothetical protein